MGNKKTLGDKGEKLAVSWLGKKGYEVVTKNYRKFGAEIDIIAMDGNTVVFVEVKSRSNNAFGLPAESVTIKKQSQIVKAAMVYLSEEEKESCPCRFDVVSVFWHTSGKHKIEHIVNAFSVDSW